MSRNRWIEWVLRGTVAVAFAGLLGCKQQLFLGPDAYQQAVTAGLPPHLETNPHGTILPPTVQTLGTAPATVLDPTRPPYFLSLKECIAVALEQGNVGVQSQAQFGIKNEIVASVGGTSGPDAIRAFALDPADRAASIERALSRFDARWVTQINWQKVDQPVAAQFLSFQQQRDAATLSSRIDKPLSTGALAGVTFNVDYSKFGTIPANQANNFVNPNYTPRVTFTFQQPLLRQFGVEINQLADSHPGRGDGADFLFPVGGPPTGLPGQSGILVTRIRRDQSQTIFEAQVNSLLVNVETAYWNLYSAYYNLYAQEEGLRQSYDGYRFTKARVDIGTDPPQQLDQAAGQFEQFRFQVYTARGQVLESERQLRSFMGIRSDDGKRLVPIDEPNLTPYIPDFYEAANETMAMRPDLLVLRQEVKISQLQLRLARNLRQPDLRLIANYDVAGLGTRLDGPELLGPVGNTSPGNAFTSLGNNQFNSWNVQLRLDVPIGFRDTNAQVRQAQLLLTRNYIQLRDGELKALEFVAQQYRQVVATHTFIAPLKARREYLQSFVYRFRNRIEIGQFQSSEYFNYLQVQRDLADAIRQEYVAIASYNSALAQLEFAKGTILRYNKIHMQEGPLPAGVEQRAADHERERVAGLKLRERPLLDAAALSPTHAVGPAVGSPALPPIAQLPPGPDLAPLPAEPKKGSAGPLPNPLPKGLPEIGAFPSPIGALPPPSGFTPMPAGGAAMPAPESIFTPAGTLTMPRFAPAPPVPRGTAGAIEPPLGPLTPLPTLPPDASGIPPTLPN